MNFPQSILAHFIMPIISAYVFLIVIYVIMGWLAAFNVIDMRNRNVAQIYYTLEKISGFVLNPIRRVVPPLGGTLDISPVLAILGLYWVNNYLLGTFLFRALGTPGI